MDLEPATFWLIAWRLNHLCYRVLLFHHAFFIYLKYSFHLVCHHMKCKGDCELCRI
jgi:hypothetical protein